MAPRIDLNLEYEETEVEATEENVTPKQSPITTPETTDDDEGIIPFRTSKRLQGAIYRMIQQRDGRSHANNVPATKDKYSGVPLPSRKVKRQLESLSPEQMDVCETEDSAGHMIFTALGCDINLKNAGSRKRKTKSFTVHFADPLFAIIDDEKKAASRQLLSISKGEEKGRHCETETPVPSAPKRSTHADGNKQRRLPPMSCFDLLCNHVGARGWRCYRTCEEGKSFCRFHDSRKTLPFDSALSQAVRI